ncbi:hypothetical protein JTB14_012251 [Gonioctena quinquepunctata]|nr:hypothetical protein JTB14_012251 [Gonioctena quinquepunctata]
MQGSDSRIFSGILTQLTASIAGSLFAISDGICCGWTAPMIPYLIGNTSHITTTEYEAEWLESDYWIGNFFGLPFTIFSVRKLGRKPSLLIATLISLLAWVFVAVANQMWYIHVARFFLGLAADMAFVAAPMYIAEIAESKIRGFLSSIVQLMMLLGYIIVYSVGPFSSFYLTPVIAIIVTIAGLSFLSFMPESPYYLLYKNKREMAEVSLKYFRHDCNIDGEMEEISKAMEENKNKKGRIQDMLLVKNNRKAMTIMTVLNCGQHMAASSVIVMNMHSILDAAGSIYMESSYAAILFSVIMLVFAITASLNVDKYGRRILYLTSAFSTSFCLLTLAIYFHLKLENYDVSLVSWIPIVAIMTYAVIFKTGLGLIPAVITSEIFSDEVKAMGMTIADAVFVTAAIVSNRLYFWLLNNYGLHVPFYLFTTVTFLIAIFNSFYLPETKGKTLEEIQLLLKGEKDVEGACYQNEAYQSKGISEYI